MSLLISAAGLVDPVTATIHSPGHVEVDGSTIRYAGTQRPSTSDKEIELPGHYLLPGLIDSHVHLCFDPNTDDCVGFLRSQSDEQLRVAMADRARAAVRFGITTLRDLGDRNYLAVSLARSGEPGFPTILAAGPPITSPGGHCHYLGGEVADAAQARDLVDRHCAAGVDLIKIMITGGILTASSNPGKLQFDEAVVRAVVDQAHRHGRLVAAHAHTAQGIQLAMHCGVDTIEHATFASEEIFDYRPELAASLAETGLWVCPTYVARPGLTWQPQHFDWRGSVLKRLHRAGVRLAGGTDAGVKQGLTHTSASWLVSSLAALGIPIPDALAAVTSGAAVACGLAGRKGQLVVGADADVLAVPTNPLEDPDATTAPALVVCRGQLLDQSLTPTERPCS